MKRLIIADAHIGQRAGDAERMVRFLSLAAGEGVGEIRYLGDAFQYLIGMSKFWTSSIGEVLPHWRELRAQGILVDLVEGNRDFFLDTPELGDFVDSSSRVSEFSAGGMRYRLDHGDQVNREDHRYLFWSKVSKSGIARVWARLLPRPVAVAIVAHMEAKLARTNKEFRYRKPVAHLMRAANAAWKEGVDRLLWGHFHTPWRYRSGTREAAVVPAWLDFRVALLIDEMGRASIVDETMTPVPWSELVEIEDESPAGDGPSGR